MVVSEEAITQVVSDASAQISDPKYIQSQVDRLMTAQPKITQYVIAHQDELGVEGVVTTLFHVAMIYQSIVEASGASPSTVDYQALDLAANSTPTLEALSKSEPILASYVASNVDLEGGEAANAVASKVLAHVAKALVSSA